jgi:hypothetical protein
MTVTRSVLEPRFARVLLVVLGMTTAVEEASPEPPGAFRSRELGHVCR